MRVWYLIARRAREGTGGRVQHRDGPPATLQARQNKTKPFSYAEVHRMVYAVGRAALVQAPTPCTGDLGLPRGLGMRP